MKQDILPCRIGQNTKKDLTSKIDKFFKSGYGKQLSIEEASNFLLIPLDELVDLAFKFQIRFHIADGKLFFIKNELAKWKWENPTLLLRVRSNIKKRGQGVFK